jgi:hypothetical protein
MTSPHQKLYFGVLVGLLAPSCASRTPESSRAAAQTTIIRSDTEVIQMLKAADNRPLTLIEVNALKSAANRGILRAYYALTEYYWMEAHRPSEAEYWTARGIEQGEPNLSVLRAGEEGMAAAKARSPDERRRLWLSEKQHLQAALDRSSALTVDTPTSVEQQLLEVESQLTKR